MPAGCRQPLDGPPGGLQEDDTSARDGVHAAAALEMIAYLASAFGEPERTIRLLAGSQRFHDGTGIARFRPQTDRTDRVRNRAQAALKPTVATAWRNAGAELSLTDAVAYAGRGRGERQARGPAGRH